MKKDKLDIMEEITEKRPEKCKYCGAPRIERPDWHWQYNCKDAKECMRKFDKETSEYLRKKYL